MFSNVAKLFFFCLCVCVCVDLLTAKEPKDRQFANNQRRLRYFIHGSHIHVYIGITVEMHSRQRSNNSTPEIEMHARVCCLSLG